MDRCDLSTHLPWPNKALRSRRQHGFRGGTGGTEHGRGGARPDRFGGARHDAAGSRGQAARPAGAGCPEPHRAGPADADAGRGPRDAPGATPAHGPRPARPPGRRHQERARRRVRLSRASHRQGDPPRGAALRHHLRQPRIPGHTDRGTDLRLWRLANISGGSTTARQFARNPAFGFVEAKRSFGTFQEDPDAVQSASPRRWPTT